MYHCGPTDYLTKWVEAKTNQKSNAHTTVCFVYELVFMHYKLPIEVVNDKDMHFIDLFIQCVLEGFMVIH